jgi:hypothetical protein
VVLELAAREPSLIFLTSAIVARLTVTVSTGKPQPLLLLLHPDTSNCKGLESVLGALQNKHRHSSKWDNDRGTDDATVCETTHKAISEACDEGG